MGTLQIDYRREVGLELRPGARPDPRFGPRPREFFRLCFGLEPGAPPLRRMRPVSLVGGGSG